MPDNVTLVPLPAYSPELNPVERLWLYLGEREACSRAWNQLTNERVQTLCNYPYIQQVSL